MVLVWCCWWEFCSCQRWFPCRIQPMFPPVFEYRSYFKVLQGNVAKRRFVEVGKFDRRPTLWLLYPGHCVSIFGLKSVKNYRSYEQTILVCFYAPQCMSTHQTTVLCDQLMWFRCVDDIAVVEDVVCFTEPQRQISQSIVRHSQPSEWRLSMGCEL